MRARLMTRRLPACRRDLLGGGSATQVLTSWCGDLKLAPTPLIRAERDKAAETPATVDVRRLLQADAAEPIRHRRVRLMCGEHLLSLADTWYVPARLTPAMNQTLDQSDTSFGTVVRPLNFHRQTLEATAPRHDPHAILRVRALLLTEAGLPFSLVIENYTPDLIAGRKARPGR